jgi:hypothetical protein
MKIIILALFTLALFFAFQICKSFMKPKDAFLTAIVITILIAAGFGMYKVRETFLNHDTKFDNLAIVGGVRVRPEDRNNGYIYSYNSSFKNGSELMFYDGYRLNGRTHGSVFD